MATAEILANTDNRSISGFNTNLNTARTTASSTSGTLAIAVSSDNVFYFIYRTFLSFTIDLPAGSVINQAQMRLTPTVWADDNHIPGMGFFDWTIYVTDANWVGNTPITSGNMQTVYTLGRTATNEALLGNRLDLSVGTPKLTGNLNLARLVVGATTYYGVRTTLDENATNYGYNRNLGIQIASVTHGTEAWRPVLVLDYTEPPPPTSVGKNFDILGPVGI